MCIRYREPLLGATPPPVVPVTLPDADSHDPVEQRRVTIKVKVTGDNGEVGQDRHVITCGHLIRQAYATGNMGICSNELCNGMTSWVQAKDSWRRVRLHSGELSTYG